MNLQNLRNEIDFIDKKILVLLNQRFQAVGDVIEYKKLHKMEIYQPQREEEIFKRLEKYIKARDFDGKELMEIMQKIIEVSKKYQEKRS